MSENREKIIKNFQNITSIENKDEAISRLKACDWNLSAAISKTPVCDKQNSSTSVPMSHSGSSSLNLTEPMEVECDIFQSFDTNIDNVGGDADKITDNRKRKRSNKSESTDMSHPGSVKKISTRLDDSELPAENLKLNEHGRIFQLKLLMLCLWRANDKYSEFRLATEMSEAEKFDDVVFQYFENGIWKFRLLQAKHKESEETLSKITLTDLLSTNDKNGFSLQKYFNSFLKIKKRINENSVYSVFAESVIDDLIIITNTGCDSELEKEIFERVPQIKLNEDSLFNTLKPDTVVYKFRKNENAMLNTFKSNFINCSDFYKLAQALADHIVKGKQINREGIFKEYNLPLLQEVITISMKDKKNLFEVDKFIFEENLTNLAKNLRDAVVKEVLNMKGKAFLCNTNDNTVLKELFANLPVVQVSEGFVKSNKVEVSSKISNVDLFSKQIVEIINYSFAEEKTIIDFKNDVKTKLKLKDDELQIFNSNVENLTGYVLIQKFGKIRFSSIFLNLNSDDLPGDFNLFKNALRKQLGQYRFNSLSQFQFNLPKKFHLYEDGEIYRRLPELHSDTDVDEFFSKLKFIVNYPNRFEINDMLGPEIRNHYKSLDSEIFQSRYYENLHNWMADQVGTFFTRERATTLFKEITDCLFLWSTEGINKNFLTDFIEEYEFKETNTLKDFLLGDFQILHIVCEDLFLTHAGLVQEFQNLNAEDCSDLQQFTRQFGYIFLYLKQLMNQEFYLHLFEIFQKNKDKFNLIVIECNIDQNIENLYKSLINIIKINNKKLLLISTDQNNCLAKRFYNHPKFMFTEDKSGFKDLTTSSKENLLRKTVTFQGYNVVLNALMQGMDQNIKNVIDACTLSKLMQGKEVQIGNELGNIGQVNDYFIDRRLRQVIINTEKVKQYLNRSGNSSDVLVICGKKFVLKSSNKIHYLEYIHDAKNMFENLCKARSEKNIHLFQHESVNLTWLNSHGSVSNILDYREKIKDDMNQSPDSLEDIINKDAKSFIISDTAGMGKSIALNKLSMLLKEYDPNRWVIVINLKYNSKALYILKQSNVKFSDLKIDQVINILLDDILESQEHSKLKNHLEKELFKNSFKATGNIAILFDGFDEISPDYKDLVIDLLKSLRKYCLLFVTTRPNMGKDLETALNTFSYELDPFTPKEQETFLINFWARTLNLSSSNENSWKKLETYAKSVIEQISKSINDKEQKLIAIPLQTRIIADIFAEKQEGLNTEWQSCREFLEADNIVPRLPINLSLLDLYEYFVKKKYYSFYLEEKKDRDFTQIGEKREADRSYEKFKKDCTLLAVDALFSNEERNYLLTKDQIEDLTNLKDHIKSGEHNEGLVDRISDEKVHFIHRTFAEYFASFHIAEKILQNSRETQGKTLQYIENVLLNTSQVFIHSIIEQLNGKHKQITNNLQVPLLSYVVENFHNHYNFIRALIHSSCNDWVKKLDENIRSPLHYAIKNINVANSLDVIYKLLSIADDIQATSILKHGNFIKPTYENSRLVKFLNIEDKNGKTALNYTISSKYLDLAFDFLLKGASLDSLNEEDLNLLVKKMIHDRKKSKNDSDEEWEIFNSGIIGAYAYQDNKYRPIQEKLFLKNPKEFKKLSPSYEQPRILSYFFVHGRVKVVKTLLETLNKDEKTKMFNTEDNNFTPLDRVNGSKEMTDEERLEITKYIVENGGKKVANGVNFITDILNTASECGHLKTFKYFISHQDQTYFGAYFRTAALNNQINIIDFLVENYSESKDKMGNDFLVEVCDSNASLKLIRKLIEHGYSLNKANDQGETSLFFAIYARAELYFIEYLVNNGADVNVEDIDHNTPLSYALQNNQTDIIKFLISKKARISGLSSSIIKKKYEYFLSPDTYDLTLNYTTLKNFELTKFHVQFGANIHKIGEHGETLLHWAVAYALVDVGELLLQYGAYFDLRDTKGRTPRDLSKNAKLSWLLDLLNELYNSENLMKTLNDRLLQKMSNSFNWGPYGSGHPDVYDIDNPTLFILNSRNHTGKTLIHIAAEKNDTLAFNKLWEFNQAYLERKRNSGIFRYHNYQSISIDWQDSQGNTPIHIAAQKGYINFVRVLLKKGAIFDKENVEGFTPEVVAKQSHHENIVQILQSVKNFFVNVTKKNLVKVKEYISADYINSRQTGGQTALHIASSVGNPSLVQLLIENFADVEAVDRNQKTPMHYAAENDQLGIIELLLKHGALYDRENSQGQTPLTVSKGHTFGLLKATDELFKNIKSDNPQISYDMLNSIHKTYGVKLSTIVNTRDKQLNTLLHFAAKYSECEIFELLLESGAVFNSKSWFKNSHTLSSTLFDPYNLTENSKIKKLLKSIENMFLNVKNIYQEQDSISSKIIANVRDNNGKTLLHHAAVCGELEILEFLLDLGADISLIDLTNCTLSERVIDYLKLRTKSKYINDYI